jgi:hypothetical protein
MSKTTKVKAVEFSEQENLLITRYMSIDGAILNGRLLGASKGVKPDRKQQLLEQIAIECTAFGVANRSHRQVHQRMKDIAKIEKKK